ncbi:MAG: translation initiation factor IF-2 [Bacteroidales bacterium]|nr:translation initiation factor IF-2 [Bacteroidales bacterium]
MTGNENIRIGKVLKEFNIGMGTLVEFLRKKGINIDSNPGAKLTGDQYALVAKEFKKEQIVKEESKKVAIKVKDITDKEPKSIEEEEPVKELFIKTTVEEVKGPKILGKIDLDRPKAPERKPEPVPQPKVEEPARPEPAPAPAEEKKVVDKTPDSPKVEPKPVPPAAQPQPKEEVKEQKPAESGHIATQYTKLAGPVIKGKIELPVQPEKGNKKRERIHRKNEKVDVAREAKQNGKPGGNGQSKTGNNSGNGQNRPQNNAGQNKQQNNKNHNNGKGSKKDKFKPVKVEIDEDAVQKQIKETYQRMVEGKGKTKGSKYRKEKRELNVQRMMEEEELEQMQSNILKVTEFVTVNDLSTMMNAPVIKVIEACMNLGLMVSINQRLDAEALVLVAEEFGYKIEFVTAEIQETIDEENEADTPEMMEERPPIVTVMGHVDHGKTSLLDYIRKANVIAGEAGGITQHIGAYNVKLPNGRKITFLDTPGHEAFTAMRARGAKVTDLAIIIVAADDAIMPQTIEAISHAQAAGCPMIFAINKIDKPAANPDKIREQLSQMNILVEDWGGKYQCQEISAKQGIGIEELLDKVLLEADMLELKANPNKKAVGTVIESSLDKGRGFLATILVQAGTLHVGDVMLSGCYTGKVKAMFNERGQKVTEAGPSTPVSILGLNGAPSAGETFNVFEDEKEAKDIANKREQLLRIQGLRTQKHITLEEIGRRIAIGNFQELNIIIKGDVDGSIEALSDSLIKLSTEEIHVNVIHKAVGAISESDVLLAAASNAIIIGFQVRPSANARKLADNEEIEIRLYSVIYDAINEVKSGIEGMLAPEEKEEVTATAEVRETFKISKVGTIAGCMVKEGKLTRNAKVRVIRDGIVVYTGVLGSLKRFKDDAKEVTAGYDCGLNIDGYNDIKVGDVVEAYQIVEIKRTL